MTSTYLVHIWTCDDCVSDIWVLDSMSENGKSGTSLVFIKHRLWRLEFTLSLFVLRYLSLFLGLRLRVIPFIFPTAP